MRTSLCPVWITQLWSWTMVNNPIHTSTCCYTHSSRSSWRWGRRWGSLASCKWPCVYSATWSARRYLWSLSGWSFIHNESISNTIQCPPSAEWRRTAGTARASSTYIWSSRWSSSSARWTNDKEMINIRYSEHALAILNLENYRISNCLNNIYNILAILKL